MPEHAWSYASGISDKPLLGLTIGDMFDQICARYPDNVALVPCHQKLRYTYRAQHRRPHQGHDHSRR